MMNYYEAQAKKMLDAIDDHAAGKLDSPSLTARASAVKAAASMLSIEIATARHGQMIDKVRPAWEARLDAHLITEPLRGAPLSSAS